MSPETQLYYQIQNKEISKEEAIIQMKFWKDRRSDFTYDYDEPYLKDHKVFEKHVLLGVTHPSIMIDYFFSTHPLENVFNLTDIAFIKPVVINPGEQAMVKILSNPLENKLEAIYTSGSDKKWEATASGVWRKTNDFPEKKIEFPEIETYADINKYNHNNPSSSVQLGKSFQTFEKIILHNGDIYAKIRIDLKIEDREYVLHPLISNSIFLSIIPQLELSDDHEGFLPFGIGDLKVKKGVLNNSCWIKVRLQKNSGEILLFDAEVFSETGEIAAVFKKCALKRLRSKDLFEKTPPTNGILDNIQAYIINEIEKQEIGIEERKSLKTVNVLNRFSQLQLDSLIKKLSDEINIALSSELFLEYNTIEKFSYYLNQVHGNELQKFLKKGKTSETGKLGTKNVAPLSTKAIEEYLQSKLQEVTKRDEKYNIEHNLMDLGLSSAQLIHLTQLVESEIGIKLEATLLFEYPNIQELSMYFFKEHFEAFSESIDSKSKKSEQNTQKEHFSKTPKESFETNKKKMSNEEDMAIIGMNGRFASSENQEDFWNHLKNQTDLMKEIPIDHWDYRPWYQTSREKDKIYNKWGSFIDDVAAFDAEFYNISPREAEWIDPQLRLLLQSVYHTAENAGYAGKFKGTDTGVFVGACFHDYADKIAELNLPVDPYIGTGNVQTILANRLSFSYDLSGPSIAVDTACSSSLVALHQACQAIKNNECKMAFVGGVNLLLSSWHYRYFCSIGALSPTGRCHTFDDKADGYTPGECIASILIKPLKEAIKDGDPIHAVIKGSASLHGGYTPSLTAPSVSGEENVIIKAWEDSGIPPETISYIEAHGTGTKLGDPIEVKALKKAFSRYTNQKEFCTIGSAKGNIGHTEGAAGIAGLIKVVLQMKNKTIPALPALETINPILEIQNSALRINQENEFWKVPEGIPRRAGISSFGFSGAYAHTIIEEYDVLKNELPENKSSACIILSAKGEKQLKKKVTDLFQYLDINKQTSLYDVAYTLQEGREHMEYRIGFISNSIPEAIQYLQKLLQTFNKGSYSVVTDDHRSTIETSQNYVLDELLKKWLGGDLIYWKDLYVSKPRIINLPGYPFQQKKYWIKEPVTNKNKTDLKRKTTYLKVVDKGVFQLILDKEDFFLSDHKVNGKACLPAVMFLDLVSRALHNESDIINIGLEEITWIKPITEDQIGKHLSIKIENTSIRENKTFIFTDLEETIFCKGKIHTPSSGFEFPSDIIPDNNFDKTVVWDKDRAYDFFNQSGLHYGSSHQGIHQVFRGNNKIKAIIRLPEELKNTKNDFIIHPAIADPILQASVILLDQYDVFDAKKHKTPMPYSVKNVIGGANLPEVIEVELTIDTKAQKTSGLSPEINIHVFDQRGKLLMIWQGLRVYLLEKLTQEIQWKTPSWNEKITTNEAVLDIQKRVIIGVNCPLILENAKKKTPEIDTVNITVDKYLSLDFTKVALEVFDILKAKSIAKTDGKTLFQIVTLPSEEAYLITGLSGLLKTVHQENPDCYFQIILVEEPSQLEQIKVTEYNSSGVEIIQFREGKQYEEKTVDLLELTSDHQKIWKKNGVYLITGGSGGIAEKLVEHILKQEPSAVVVLLGRRAQNQVSWLKKWIQKEYKLVYLKNDLEDSELLYLNLKQIIDTYGTINGVIHAAGITRDNFLIHKTKAEFAEVLNPKVSGVHILDKILRTVEIDFFCLFSSISGAFGNVGQADYAVANSYLDRFARQRNQQVSKGIKYGKTLSINWPLWKEGGIKVSDKVEAFIEKKYGIQALETDTALILLEKAIQSKESILLPVFNSTTKIHSEIKTDAKSNPKTYKAQPYMKNDNEEIKQKVIFYFKELMAGILKLDASEIDERVSMEKYGIDSIMIMELTHILESVYGTLPKTLFFEYKRIWELVDYFIEKHREKTISLIKTEKEENLEDEIDLDTNSETLSKKSTTFSATEKDKNPLDIAIIGISGKYPKAENLEKFWANLVQGQDCVTEIPLDRWDHAKYYDAQKGIKGKTYSKWGGFIDDVACFDPMFFGITPLEAEYMDPQERLFLECAYATLEDAGYTRERLQSDLDYESGPDIGVFAGVMYEEYQLYGAQLSQMGEVRALGGSPASVANRVSHYFDLHGPSMGVDTMCSSGLTAIDLACKSLRNDDCEAALAGAVNTSLHPNKYIMLSQGNFISSKGKCESFGIGGEGYVPGEGVGIVMLKRLDKAVEDGDHIYGVIKSSVINHGGKTNGFTVPNPQAQASVIKKAIKKSGIHPDDISYIEAHGTGTALGDPIEIAGLNRAFYDRTNPCPIGSVKSNIGHCESAAGISGLTKIILQLKYKKLVPSLHSEILNPNIDFSDTPFYVQQKQEEWLNPIKEIDGELIRVPRIAAISSFGAGGSNAHMIIQEYIKPTPIITESFEHPIVLSAKTKEQLLKKTAELLAFIKNKTQKIRLVDIAFTLQIGKEVMKHKVGFVASSLVDLVKKLTSIIESAENKDVQYNQPDQKRKKELNRQEIYDTTEKPLVAREIISYWLEGRPINWTSLQSNKSGSIISLPTYPFAKEKYWPNLDILEKDTSTKSSNDDSKETVWVQKIWEEDKRITSDHPKTLSNVCIITTQETHILATALSKSVENGEVIYINDLQEISDSELDKFEIIIDLTALSEKEDVGIQVIPFLQRIIPLKKNSLRVLGVFKEPVQPNGALMALYKTVGLEYNIVEANYILFENNEEDVQTKVIWILNELKGSSTAQEVRIEGKTRKIPRLKEVLPNFKQSSVSFDAKKVVWITGGTRGIGYTCAEYLVEKYTIKKLVLTGKTPFPPEKEWHSVQNPILIEKIANIKKLQQKGVIVHVNAVNISDPKALNEEVHYINSNLGKIGTVIHAAGIADFETPAFISKEEHTIKEVLQPKQEGTKVLLASISNQPIDKVLLFSSVSALIPSLAVGQIDYAIANHNMDLIAQKHEYHFDIISIQWPNWKDSGMGEVKSKSYHNMGLISLSDQEGLSILEDVLKLSDSQAIMPAVIKKKLWYPEQLLNVLKKKTSISIPKKEPDISFSNPKESDKNVVEEWLVNLFSSELRIPKDRLEKDMDFSDFGVDSIILTQLMKSVNKYLKSEIDPSTFYEYTNINRLTYWIYENHKDKFIDHSNQKTSDKKEEAQEYMTAKVHNSPVEYAIIGMSCRFPNSKNTHEFWDLLAAGKTAIRRIPVTRWGNENAGYAALLDSIEEFDPAHFLITPEDAASMDPQALLILEETLHLIYQAGYNKEEIKGTPTGVYIGARSRHNPDKNILRQSKNPIVALGQNYLAANVSQYFDFSGPSLVVDTACSSALTAMDIACKDLNNGDVHQAIIGGVNLLQTEEAQNIFKQRNLLNETGEFHVFDKKANGVILGEGIGMVMIKRLEDALKDGDKIEAIISGIAINNDGRTSGHATPNMEAQKGVMKKALNRAGAQPEEITHIETNGSGTELTDLLELKAIKSVYPGNLGIIRSLGSIKPNIGHPLCAEGIAGVIKLTLMLKHRSKVPFISGHGGMKHFDIKEEGYQLDRKKNLWGEGILKGALNCFADGGTNAHLILRSVQEEELHFQNRKEQKPPELIPSLITSRDKISHRPEIKPLHKKKLKVRNFWEETAICN